MSGLSLFTQAPGAGDEKSAGERLEIVFGHWIVIRPMPAEFNQQPLFSWSGNWIYLHDLRIVIARGFGNGGYKIGNQITR